MHDYIEDFASEESLALLSWHSFAWFRLDVTSCQQHVPISVLYEEPDHCLYNSQAARLLDSVLRY